MPTLTIALAQINPTIGDIDGNLALMIEAAQRAHAEGARLVAFPELSLPAY
jgi:predicted amidohydrolase